MSPRPRRGGAAFQPRFTLTIVYFAAFFLLYAAVLVAPALFEVARSVPPGPEQQAASYDAARAALSARFPIALVASLATLALGIFARVLPGLRRPR
jgi:hypothetical protein